MVPHKQSEVLAAFARQLRLYWEKKGFSQEELAEKAGLDRTYVSGCERGVRNPTLRSVEKLSLALGVHPKDLLGP